MGTLIVENYLAKFDCKNPDGTGSGNFNVQGIFSHNNTTILVKGIDKQAVGQMAAVIRSKRPPEPYLGKGIKYAGERIRRKAGKTGK